MKTVGKRRFYGAICERLIYNVADGQDVRLSREPRPRFKNEEEREKHRNEMSRRQHERLFNANFSPASLYSTLTCDQEDELHSFPEAKKLFGNFIRRLKRKYKGAVIFSYMGRGRHTHRIHFHMVSNGIPEEYIQKEWYYGSVLRIEHLREHNYYDGIDRGQDYAGLANYLWGHWTPEQGGHRWRATKNARKPEEEPAKEVKRKYSKSKPPRAPKGYVLAEAKATGYGLLYFKYVREPGEDPRRKRGRRREPGAVGS